MSEYMYPHKFPAKGDLVTVRVKEVNDTYSMVELLEYSNINGMIPHSHLSKKKIYNLSQVIKTDKQMILEVLNIDIEKANIDLTNKYLDNKQKYMDDYKKAVSLHTVSRNVSELIGWQFHDFLERIIYPVYLIDKSAFDYMANVFDDVDKRKELIDSKFDNDEQAMVCINNFGKLFGARREKFKPINVTFVSKGGVDQIKQMGVDSDVELVAHGILVKVVRIGESYNIMVLNKNVTKDQYDSFSELILTVFRANAAKYGVEMFV